MFLSVLVCADRVPYPAERLVQARSEGTYRQAGLGLQFKFRVARIAGVKLIDLRASSTRPPGKPVVIGLGRVGPPVPVARLASKLTVGAGEQPGGTSASLSASGQNRANPPFELGPFRLGISELEASSRRLKRAN